MRARNFSECKDHGGDGQAKRQGDADVRHCALGMLIQENGARADQDQYKSAYEFANISFHFDSILKCLAKVRTSSLILSLICSVDFSRSSAVPVSADGSSNDQLIFLCMPGKTGQRSDASLSQTVMTTSNVFP